jgi:hypothetical protein
VRAASERLIDDPADQVPSETVAPCLLEQGDGDLGDGRPLRVVEHGRGETEQRGIVMSGGADRDRAAEIEGRGMPLAAGVRLQPLAEAAAVGRRQGEPVVEYARLVVLVQPAQADDPRRAAGVPAADENEIHERTLQ